MWELGGGGDATAGVGVAGGEPCAGGGRVRAAASSLVAQALANLWARPYCFIALDFVPTRLIHRLVLHCSDDTVSSLESARGCPGST